VSFGILFAYLNCIKTPVREREKKIKMYRMYRHWFWHSFIMRWCETRVVKLNNYIWRKRWSGKFRN